MNNRTKSRLMTAASSVLTFAIVFTVASHGEYSISETLMLAADVLALGVTSIMDGHYSGIALAIKAIRQPVKL